MLSIGCRLMGIFTKFYFLFNSYSSHEPKLSTNVFWISSNEKRTNCVLCMSFCCQEPTIHSRQSSIHIFSERKRSTKSFVKNPICFSIFHWMENENSILLDTLHVYPRGFCPVYVLYTKIEKWNFHKMLPITGSPILSYRFGIHPWLNKWKIENDIIMKCN